MSTRWVACVITVLTAAVFSAPVTALAAPVPVATDGAVLTSMESGLGGSEVVIEGELISEVMSADEGHVWINVLSNGVGIGVYAPEALVSGIGDFGHYDRTGEMLRVTGTFNEGCDQHGGDLDLHAGSIERIAAAEARSHEIGWWKLWLGIVALSCALGVWGLSRWRMRRSGS